MEFWVGLRPRSISVFRPPAGLDLLLCTARCKQALMKLLTTKGASSIRTPASIAAIMSSARRER